MVESVKQKSSKNHVKEVICKIAASVLFLVTQANKRNTCTNTWVTIKNVTIKNVGNVRV